jgi:para-nitrobenzyl esterase
MDKVSSDVYLYWFNWHPPVQGKDIYGAFHGADLPYVFGQLTLFGIEPTDADRTFSEFMAETWVRFASTGNPNGGGIEGWQAFTPENEAYYILGPEPSPADALRLPEMALIEKAWAKRRASSTPDQATQPGASHD